MSLLHESLQMAALLRIPFDESVSVLVSWLAFALLGIALVMCLLGVACRRSQKRHGWRCPISCRHVGISRTKESAVVKAKDLDRKSHCVEVHAQTPQEHLAVEVATLLSEGQLRSALDLVHSYRSANGGMYPGMPCLRMISQRAAQSALDPEVLQCLQQELASVRDEAVDTLIEGCYVRYLCRAPHADIDRTYEAYTSMLNKGVRPDIRTVECLAEACLRKDRHAWVKSLIVGLDGLGIEPSAVLHAALMTCCGIMGAVTCGMATFEEMRPHMRVDCKAFHLGYSAAIHMCAQNGQMKRALALWAESHQSPFCRGQAALNLDAHVLPSLLAASVQKGQERMALDLARKAHYTMAGLAPDDIHVKRKFVNLCEMLSKRSASQSLMSKVAAILSGKDDSMEPTRGIGMLQHMYQFVSELASTHLHLFSALSCMQ